MDNREESSTSNNNFARKIEESAWKIIDQTSTKILDNVFEENFQKLLKQLINQTRPI